jgi:hypothetical protein
MTTRPPSNTSYYDQVMLMCEKCSNPRVAGGSNQCYLPPTSGKKDDYNWLFQSAAARAPRPPSVVNPCQGVCPRGQCSRGAPCAWQQLGHSGLCQVQPTSHWGNNTFATQSDCVVPLKHKYTSLHAAQSLRADADGDGGGGEDDGGVKKKAEDAPPGCCADQTDPTSGQTFKLCDVSRGCGWTSAFPGQVSSCHYVDQGAVYPTRAACDATIAPPAPEPTPGDVKWYSECANGKVANCYFTENASRPLDNCVAGVWDDPSFFLSPTGEQPEAFKLAAQHQKSCPYYVCNTDTYRGEDGRRSFDAASCRCISASQAANL